MSGQHKNANCLQEKAGRRYRVDNSKLEITDDTDYEASRRFHRVVGKKLKLNLYYFTQVNLQQLTKFMFKKCVAIEWSYQE